jgi:TrmH family RNA methyltransferase
MNAPTQAQIKEAAALKQKKFRDETGLILVEGRHPIEEAIQAGLSLQSVFMQTDAPLASLPQVPIAGAIFDVNAAAMERLSSTASPPPCVAIFEQPKQPKMLKGEWVLVLDGLQDPGNLGTLLRSAVAFGVDSVVLAGDCVEAYSPKVIRSSAGLVFALPVLAVAQADLSGLFSDDWRIYTTTGDPRAQSYRAVDYAGRCALVLGNEGRGVSADLFAGRPLEALTIPMAGRVESLNVAVSGAIILAEAAARRGLHPRVESAS